MMIIVNREDHIKYMYKEMKKFKIKYFSQLI